jgi:DNA-binding NarL/FixJ family response regulator
MPEIRVLIVGDDPLARSAIARLLSDDPEIAIAGQASADEAASGAAAIAADVAVWDLGLDPKSSIERLRDLEESGLPWVALVASAELGAAAIAAGARGALFRYAEGGRLIAALRSVVRGLVVLDESLADAALRPRAAHAAPPIEMLTPRELEVLGLLSQGLSNKSIADRLRISEHTAKFHVNSILAKLGAEGRTEAVVRAAKLGLVVL